MLFPRSAIPDFGQKHLHWSYEAFGNSSKRVCKIHKIFNKCNAFVTFGFIGNNGRYQPVFRRLSGVVDIVKSVDNDVNIVFFKVFSDSASMPTGPSALFGFIVSVHLLCVIFRYV